MSNYQKDNSVLSQLERESAGQKLFSRLGGRATLERVHKIFYDKIYRDPWIGQFFASINQTHIEAQQTDFMAQLMGGPKNYMGRMPIDAHMHMFITDELIQLRHELLAASLIEAGVPEAERADWLRLDGAFKKVMVKTKLEECQRRFASDEIIAFTQPTRLSKVS